MRVNIYEEELTSTVELVTTSPSNGGHVGITFYGVRIYLKSHPHLHYNELDDDRSAVTIWVGDKATAEILRDAFARTLKVRFPIEYTATYTPVEPFIEPIVPHNINH